MRQSILTVASAAFFIASAHAQSGTVTQHAFAIGKGAGVTGYTSLLCGSAQLAVGQAAADPICVALTGDVTMSAAGVTAIGAGKVLNSMIAPMTSAQLAAILSDETGTGAAVFGTAPTISTPMISAPTISGLANFSGARKDSTQSTPAQITADQNDYNPSSVVCSTSSTLIINSDIARNITGIAGGVAGCDLFLFNNGSFPITLKDGSASSLAANRFALGADFALGSKAAAHLKYDGNGSVWRNATGSGSGGGSGTVTQVNTDGGLSGGPVTTSGTVYLQTQNPGGRLTLTASTPITTTDVVGATVVNYAPISSMFVPIYDGTKQRLYQFTSSDTDTVGLQVTLGANWASGSAYDWFIGLNGGVVTLCSGPAWTSAAAGTSSRGTGAGTTELQLFKGLWTNKNVLTCRYANASTFSCPVNQCTYIGSSLMTGAGATEDSAAKRYTFNLYNQVLRKLENPNETAASWSYTLATWRQTNANASNQFSVFVGLPGNLIDVRAESVAGASAGGSFPAVGIGINSSTTDSAEGHTSTNASANSPISATLKTYPGLGLQNFLWLEAADIVSGTNSYTGRNINGGVLGIQPGIQGSMLM